MSGNAWAHQDNNTLRGNRLTVYLADTKKDKPKEEVNPFADKKKKAPIDENSNVDKPFENKDGSVVSENL